jgi:antitoxin (DNA-binding transcriptional repressor) of toxin-antitoxin stability system
MKAASVYHVQHHFSRVLAWVAAGETVVVSRRHHVPVAKLVPAKAKGKRVPVAMPDFMARLKKNYGERPLPDSQSALDELREDRY